MFAALSRGYRDFVAHIRRPQAHAQQRETTATDPHIFFTLPPEIRHHIYRLLMVSRDDERWIHTTILPILGCSRRFNQDATPIFYGENVFRLEWFVGSPSLLGVWPPSSEKFALVSKMAISRSMQAYNINEVLPKFPSLWEVELNLGTGAQRGAVLLKAAREQLERIERIILVFLIEHNDDLFDPWDVLRKEYARGYGDVLDVPEGYLTKRKMRLEYRAPEGTYSKLGAPGILRLTFEPDGIVLGRGKKMGAWEKSRIGAIS
jgi:hypothetical protein